ncbi:MAG TPA: methyltransferase domain-containing protein [candidate division Zixibacteria bacterium]|jgi:ubiquinone/menaquinone biosynthesis C-methylase UbiE
MNKIYKEILNLKNQFALTTEEAKEYYSIIQQRLEEEVSAVKKLNLLKGNIILECSTGSGNFTRKLLDKILKPDQTLYTIDSSPEMIKKISSSIKRKNLHPQVADLWKLPFPDNHFDALVSHYTLHSLRSKNRDFLKPIKEMVRVLKPGAPFVAMTFYYTKGKNLPAYFYHRLIQLNYLDKKMNFFGLQKPEIYRELLKKAGLRQIKSKVINYDSIKFPEELRNKLWDVRLKEEKSFIKKIKSSKLKREAQKVLESFENRSELKNQKISPTLLLWGKT